MSLTVRIMHLYILIYTARPLRPADDSVEQAAYREKKKRVLEKWMGLGYLKPDSMVWSKHEQDHKVAMVRIYVHNYHAMSYIYI